jgi:integrase
MANPKPTERHEEIQFRQPFQPGIEQKGGADETALYMRVSTVDTGRTRTHTPKTDSSIRVVPLTQSTVQLILQWRAKSKRTNPDDLILAGRKGTPGGQARMLKNHIKPACTTLGLKPATG